jgi:hypothetical protein
MSGFSCKVNGRTYTCNTIDKVVGSSGALVVSVLIASLLFSTYYGFKPLITALCSNPFVETPLPPKGPF